MHIVTISKDNTALIWNMVMGVYEGVLKHSDNVSSAAFSSDGMHIVTASYDHTA